MKSTLENTEKPPQYLRGFADAKLKEAENMDTVFSSLIPEYNIDRFEAVAIRIFLGKETNLTLYAIDKSRKLKKEPGEKLPVKKFKLILPIEEIISHFSNINLTINKDDFDLENFEIINK